MPRHTHAHTAHTSYSLQLRNSDTVFCSSWPRSFPIDSLTVYVLLPVWQVPCNILKWSPFQPFLTLTITQLECFVFPGSFSSISIPFSSILSRACILQPRAFVPDLNHFHTIMQIVTTHPGWFQPSHAVELGPVHDHQSTCKLQKFFFQLELRLRSMRLSASRKTS